MAQLQLLDLGAEVLGLLAGHLAPLGPDHRGRRLASCLPAAASSFRLSSSTTTTTTSTSSFFSKSPAAAGEGGEQPHRLAVPLRRALERARLLQPLRRPDVHEDRLEERVHVLPRGFVGRACGFGGC